MELLYGQLHNRVQQAKEDLTTFTYEHSSIVQSRHRNTKLFSELLPRLHTLGPILAPT
nr:unnamed protein product [Callosobruchus chinensis]